MLPDRERTNLLVPAIGKEGNVTQVESDDQDQSSSKVHGLAERVDVQDVECELAAG